MRLPSAPSLYHCTTMICTLYLYCITYIKILYCTKKQTPTQKNTSESLKNWDFIRAFFWEKKILWMIVTTICHIAAAKIRFDITARKKARSPPLFPKKVKTFKTKLWEKKKLFERLQKMNYCVEDKNNSVELLILFVTT